MNLENRFVTAVPVVTDDDGFLGYLWKGVIYVHRRNSCLNLGQQSLDFTPAYETDILFYAPDEAMNEAEAWWKKRISEIIKEKIK